MLPTFYQCNKIPLNTHIHIKSDIKILYRLSILIINPAKYILDSMINISHSMNLNQMIFIKILNITIFSDKILDIPRQ